MNWDKLNKNIAKAILKDRTLTKGQKKAIILSLRLASKFLRWIPTVRRMKS